MTEEKIKLIYVRKGREEREGRESGMEEGREKERKTIWKEEGTGVCVCNNELKEE